MSRPVDSDGALDRSAMTALLTAQFTDQIVIYQDLLRHVVAKGEPSHRDSRWPVEENPVEGPSLTEPHLRIHVSHSYQEATNLGSFLPGMKPMCLRIHVQGYSDHYPDREAVGTDLADAADEVEREAWARALRGPWSDGQGMSLAVTSMP